MKNWSPQTFILFSALAFVAIAGNFGWTYDPLTPDNPRVQAAMDAFNKNAEERNLEGDPRLSVAREEHILYGDVNGGGHHHSANRPCKTEFPESWTPEKIISVTKELAANDNAAWIKEDNGYYVTEQPYEGLIIRVVLDQEGDDIITAYPINLPRNDCPN